MKPIWRDTAVVLSAGVLGALASLLIGASPASVVVRDDAGVAWDIVRMRQPDLVAADAGWSARAPWGALPKPVEPPPPPPPAPPIPVGVVGSGRLVEAIFLVPSEGSVRVAVGGRLPDGGEVLGIKGMQVDWVDGEGQRHKRRLFIDPPQLPAAGSVE